jgi:hypothetical protein
VVSLQATTMTTTTCIYPEATMPSEFPTL